MVEGVILLIKLTHVPEDSLSGSTFILRSYWYHSFCKEFVLAITMVAIGRGLPFTSLTEAVSRTALKFIEEGWREVAGIARARVYVCARIYGCA